METLRNLPLDARNLTGDVLNLEDVVVAPHSECDRRGGLTRSIQISGSEVVRVSVTEPHSLSETMLEELLGVLTMDLAADTRVLVLTNSHPEALLAEVARLKGIDSKQALAFSELGQRVCAAIEELDVPVIAAIDGLALGGGCELTLACDLVYATEKSRFGQIEVLGGIVPSFGGTWRLPHRIGTMKALEMLLTGAALDGLKAKAVGLVTEILPQANLLEGVDAVAESIAAGAPLAIRAIKTLALANRDQTLPASNLLERQIFAALFGTADQKEGMTAFMEKRKAIFKGA